MLFSVLNVCELMGHPSVACKRKIQNAATPPVGLQHSCQPPCHQCGRSIHDSPHAPSGVAAFMSADSKTPYITLSMEFPSGKGVIRGRRGQQLGIFLACAASSISTPAKSFAPLAPCNQYSKKRSNWETFKNDFENAFPIFYSSCMEEHTCGARLPHINGNVARDRNIGDTWAVPCPCARRGPRNRHRCTWRRSPRPG